VNGARWQAYAPSTPLFADVPTTSPYYGYVERAATNGVTAGYACGGPGEPCPGTYFRAYNTTTRAQASKMISLSRPRRTPTPATNTSTRTPTRTRTTTGTATSSATRTNTPPSTPTAPATG